MSASKTLTASVVLATVFGAMGFISVEIDHQKRVADEASHWWMPQGPQPVQTMDHPATLSTSSPMDIDPRRMEAPPSESLQIPAAETTTTTVADSRPA